MAGGVSPKRAAYRELLDAKRLNQHRRRPRRASGRLRNKPLIVIRIGERLAAFLRAQAAVAILTACARWAASAPAAMACEMALLA